MGISDSPPIAYNGTHLRMSAFFYCKNPLDKIHENCTHISFYHISISFILASESEVTDMPYQNFQPYYPQRQEIIKVNGRAGAEMYQLAPNSSVLMLDETNNLVWFKMTDGAGYATLKPFSLVPYEEPKPVDTKALEERIARLEEALNDKSDTGNAQSAKHTPKPRQN